MQETILKKQNNFTCIFAPPILNKFLALLARKTRKRFDIFKTVVL